MRAVIVFILSLWLAPPVLAQEGPGAAIAEQFRAFRDNDLPRAFSYASPMIRGYFGTPETFGEMVARGYPAIRDPGEIRLLDLRDIGGRLVQRVQVLDGNGLPHLFDYEVIETQDGWKINGVRYVGAPPAAV